MRWFCRNCSCFVRSPLARCGNCATTHSRAYPALEEPIRLRRPRARCIPIRPYRR